MDSSTKELMEKIRDLRQQLNSLIEMKDNLQAPEVIQLSKSLDEKLSAYEKEAYKKLKKE